MFIKNGQNQKGTKKRGILKDAPLVFLIFDVLSVHFSHVSDEVKHFV